MMEATEPLSQQEVDEFIAAIDTNHDGFIEYDEVESMLDKVHHEIAAHPAPHHLHHDNHDDIVRHRFLRKIMSTECYRISSADFAHIVHRWRIPSLNPDKKDEEANKNFIKSMPLWRRLRAFWSVRGTEVIFVLLVTSITIAFTVWKMVIYIVEPQWRRALGWGVVLSRSSAGALYSTLFFLILSMSRYLSTFARKSVILSRFINWDLSQSFHVKISLVTLLLAVLHTIGHLAGTFVHGSRPQNEPAVAAIFGPQSVPRPYIAYVASLPGWTGLTAFGIFWLILIFSLPSVRNFNYELFQGAHLLMFPMIGLLIAHGQNALLKPPMLGYWLAFPTLLVVVERGYRFFLCFHHVPAEMAMLDADTVSITTTLPKRGIWPYKAGQYVLVQVPQISFFQWHPFTISSCVDNEIKIHIKTDGNWTKSLRELQNGQKLRYVGIDGPFGAPAQRFYEFDHTIIIGSGIGITPFAGILTDLQNKWDRHRGGDGPSLSESEPGQTVVDLDHARHASHTRMRSAKDGIDLIKGEQLSCTGFLRCSTADEIIHNPNLNIRIHTHVTQKRRDICTHVFRCLLENHRTTEHPASPLTGLINPTHFGRPCLSTIMEEHYNRMQISSRDSGRKVKIGVFFCGSPTLGYELAERCKLLTQRGYEDKSRIEYHFMMEVF